MKIKELTLQNVRSYKNQTVTFPEGTILIHGANGVGKTSLLVGIFGGLFLSDITTAGEQSFTLDDLIRRGEDKAHVELTFELDGTDYTVEWTFYATSTGPSATVTSPAFAEPISQVSNVKAKMRELLGMDEDDFSASVYVRQGEINRLIDADTRTELIDSLLDLDAIDAYISKMEGAKRGAKRVRRANETARENAEKKREREYERDEAQFEAEIQQLTEEIQEVKADKAEIKAYIEKLEQHRTTLDGQIDAYETTRKKIETKEEQLSEAAASRTTTERKRHDAREEIETAQAAITDIEAKIASLNESVEHDLSTEKAARRAVEAVQDDYTTAHQQRTKREAALQNARDALEDLEQRHSEKEDTAASVETALEERREALEAKRTELAKAQGTLNQRIEERNRKAGAFLPDAGDDEITDRDRIDTRIEQLDEKREQTEKELTRIRTKLDGKTSERERIRAAIEEQERELESAHETLEERRSELEALTEAVTTAESEFQDRVHELDQTSRALGIDISPDSLATVRDERIPAKRSTLTSEIESINEEIARLDARKEQIESELETLRTLDDHETCPTCGQPIKDAHVDEEIERQREELATTTDTLSERRAAKADRQDERDDVDALLKGVHDAIAYRADVLTPRRNEREEKRTQIEAAQADIDSLSTELGERQNAVRELEADIKTLERDAAEREELIESHQAAIEEGNVVRAAFEAVERHRETVETLRDAVTEIETMVEEYETDLEEIRTDIEAVESQIQSQRQTVTECKKAVQTAEKQVERVEKEKSVVEQAVERYEAIGEHRSEIDRLKQTIAHCEEKIESLNQRLSTLKREKEEFEVELGETDIDTLRENRQKVTERIEEREATVTQHESKIQSLREKRTSREKDLESLRGLKDDIDRYERYHRWADATVGEIDTMLAVYRRSKSKLREQYLSYLREYTNDIFDEVYKNSSYQQVVIREIETSGGFEYDLKLLRDDQQLEDPSNASGGERAIVNLALRAGIYRLIAELKGDDRGTLPPFILDEPTTFLDEGHVSQLEEMLDTIKSWDVPQIIVVSHDKRLIHGADNECRITIDEETNTSQIEMRSAGDTTAVGDD
ncbi:AAA family ATPase [Halocatena salina]|uniref:AAA family ATPase n=1 Tax=Halocatena salina TaxID=2934340 RepID=A0A8U0A6U4_9EURY|nr:AAA family ATPase [Halocatena salina]UPM44248.1 AAA family ATPase [Halocatena salina]